MRSKDRYSLIGTIFLLVAAIFSGLMFRPKPSEGELLQFQVVGEDTVLFTTHLANNARGTNAVFSVEPNRKCVLIGRAIGDRVILKLKERLRRNSSMIVKCERRTFADGSHAVRMLILDGEVLLSFQEADSDESWNRALYKSIAIFAWIFGVYFVWRGVRQK